MTNNILSQKIVRLISVFAAPLLFITLGTAHQAIAALPPVNTKAPVVLPAATGKAAVSKAVSITKTVAPALAPRTLTIEEIAQAAEAATNRVRVENGLAPLAHNDKLAAVAEAYSKRMATEAFFAHTAPDGKQFFERAADGGYSYQALAENLAMMHLLPGDDVAETAVKGWVKSPGHHENLMNASYTESAIGVYRTADGRYYFTQIFGKPL